MMLLIIATVALVVWFWFLAVRPVFLDTMVQVQQYRIRRLLLDLEESAVEGNVDTSSEWYRRRSRVIELYADLPSAVMPGLFTVLFALRRTGKRPNCPATSDTERDFDGHFVLLVIQMLRYRSFTLWSALKLLQLAYGSARAGADLLRALDYLSVMVLRRLANQLGDVGDPRRPVHG